MESSSSCQAEQITGAEIAATDKSTIKQAQSDREPSTSLLTTEEVAQQLRLAPVTIKLSRQSGLLLGLPPPPHIKVGRLVRYRNDDVVRWIQSLHATGPTTG